MQLTISLRLGLMYDNKGGLTVSGPGTVLRLAIAALAFESASSAAEPVRPEGLLSFQRTIWTTSVLISVVRKKKERGLLPIMIDRMWCRVVVPATDRSTPPSRYRSSLRHGSSK